MVAIVVVDRREDWPIEIPGVDVVTHWEYLTDDELFRRRGMRVYNLCRSFAYQSNGYYVSLLASARAQRPLPDITTIQDLKLAESPRVVNDELEALARKSLAPISSNSYELHIYFGKSVAKRHERLAQELFNLFPAPLLKVRFSRRNNIWRVSAIGAIALGDVPPPHRELLFVVAQEHFARRRVTRRRKSPARFELAILTNSQEKESPSNTSALKRFARAGEALGVAVDFIEKADYGRVAEYDALFIRETTAVNHHTYRFARRAAREGLVVIDDPMSILRCTNKVFLAQLLQRQRIPIPKTLLVHKANVNQVATRIGFPCVLKQPDSAFSRGVVKVDSDDELRQVTRELLQHSDLIVAQTFEPTDYDWRIGILAGEPLYACRYFMAPRHWQIVKRSGSGSKTEGEHETVIVENVPEHVLNSAIRAARAVGNGLYGVDLKQFGRACKVIEVNDNPNIDHGIEDQVLGDALYQQILSHFVARLETRGRNG